MKHGKEKIGFDASTITVRDAVLEKESVMEKNEIMLHLNTVKSNFST